MQQRKNAGDRRNYRSRSNGSARKFRFSRRKSSSRGRKFFSGDRLSESLFINKNLTPDDQKVYQPQNVFSDFAIDPRLQANIKFKQYLTPTPIQDKCIPLILAGKDIIGLANTGTGKTAAFLIPLVNKVLTNPNEKVLIIAPTRELAGQIDKEFSSFAYKLGVHSVLVTGGTDMRRQISSLKRRHNFIIGTPGRLNDLLRRNKLRLGGITNVVIDEADHMLDMGFIEDIRILLGRTNSNKQTLLFSATLAPKIEALISDFLKNPTKISVRTKDTNSIYQDIVRYNHTSDKPEILLDLLNKREFQKILIFAKTKRGVDELSKILYDYGLKNVIIHGDRRQSKRRRALEEFKTNNVKVMIATDVASRGLDINNVTHVINYDIPATKDDYIHRIGRTARANKTGVALTFVKTKKQSFNRAKSCQI